MSVKNKSIKIGIVGLGYVGLPLAVEFGKCFETVGYDIDRARVCQLRDSIDLTNECSLKELQSAHHLKYSEDLEDLATCNFYIVTVPTPIDEHKTPDLSCLVSSASAIGGVLCENDIVVFESTVYPGATEEVCIPILEQYSNLKFNKDFYVGYSPERINPGDKVNRLRNIKKITSGSTPEAAKIISDLYGNIIDAGIHMAPSIKVAEAAKVIENTQRDLNIALVNEFALIFDRLNIDTGDVLEAAATKWNFLHFKPGLVGGHCIGVDPYYLCHKAQSVGYFPDIILAGRRINDGMAGHIASTLIKEMIRKKIQVSGAKVLVLGFAFKEDCPDVRNTKVMDIVNELKSYQTEVVIHDPEVDAKMVSEQYAINMVEQLSVDKYDALILAVGHKKYCAMGASEIRKLGKSKHIFYDVKSVFTQAESDLRL